MDCNQDTGSSLSYDGGLIFIREPLLSRAADHIVELTADETEEEDEEEAIGAGCIE